MAREKQWGSGQLWGARGCRAWEPATDIYQTKDGWVVKMDLAGVAADDLTVKIADSTLSVSGTRRDRTLREGVWHYQMEITYSRFERSIQLPCSLAEARIQSEYDNGLLTITFTLRSGGNEERANE
jgi:HSP20 family protein